MNQIDPSTGETFGYGVKGGVPLIYSEKVGRRATGEWVMEWADQNSHLVYFPAER